MNVCVTGSLGYIGWPTVVKILRHGHEVIGIDNNFRDGAVKLSGSDSIIPINSVKQRKKALKSLGKYNHNEIDICDYNSMKYLFKEYRPDFVIHLAGQPSAPYSMIDPATATFTQRCNNEGTMNILWCMKEYTPNSTLIFPSTVGVYGQPSYIIPKDGLLQNTTIPYQGGSFYHLSKILDEQNITLASKQWGLKSLILRQGVVFGSVIRDFRYGVKQINFDYGDTYKNSDIDPFLDMYPTRFDIDKYFGTSFNRFVAQAIMGYGITVYGKGLQTRAFVTLNHAVNNLISLIDRNNMPDISPDEPRPYNTLIRNSVTKCFNLTELTNIIKNEVENSLGTKVNINHIQNPRKEKEENDLIMEQPPKHLDLQLEIRTMINMIKPHIDRLEKYKEAIL